MANITVKSVRASTLVETKGAVDADVEVDGVHYGVTLCPRQHDGVLDSWGNIDHRVMGQRDPFSLGRETLGEIAAEVREAAARAL